MPSSAVPEPHTLISAHAHARLILKSAPVASGQQPVHSEYRTNWLIPSC